MKRLIYILKITLLSVSGLAAQEIRFPEKSLDTIYANDQKNVALFFPEPIRQGITGSENFVFTYNRDKEQHLGLLQATPGNDSNLLVISANGSVFSYIVSYSETLDNLNYFISESGSIGKENGNFGIENLEEFESISTIKPAPVLSQKASYFQNFCSYLLQSKQRLGIIKKRKEGVSMSVRNIVFNGEELYFVLKLENDSPIDYELSFLSIAVETRQKGKKKSMQKLIQEPVYKYMVPDLVAKGASTEFVYVLPKFSIGGDKVVVIDLKEENGERDIKLKVKKKYINNPN